MNNKSNSVGYITTTYICCCCCYHGY